MEFGEEKEPERLEFEAELRRYALASPFVPFDIMAASGNEYHVREPLQMAFGHSAIVIVLPKTGVQLVRISQVTAVHIHEQV